MLVQIVTSVALTGGVVFMALSQLGLLPERSTTSYWRDRAESAEVALASVSAANEQLRGERTNEPVLAVIASVLDRIEDSTRIQAETLERFVAFNGSLKHVEQGLRDATEGLKTVTGWIAELHDLPVTPKTP